ncbi:putative glycosyl hydrolase, five-bladed beta-propellor domain superfamily [Helianthus annuus]|nr:putative glycosyl hydrolase, five-bladed beta-propellor domain superfamily [Helianthus annuus]KAJ0630015.1 putative glycosyl hydrolase, five-bladed beta-propellor domain superfamily [Helianthus annuus]KAJ0830823.1 putative glycosyl hydrolase, five-bladed beta-propellor domain superfamily [Helianthus annuus]
MATTTTVNPLLLPTTPRSSRNTPPPYKRSNLLDVHPSYSSFLNTQIIISSNPRNHHKNPIFIPNCSTKPTISDDKDNVIKDQDSTISSDPDQDFQNPQKPTSDQPNPSPNPSVFVSRGLVLDLGQEGSWDSFEVGSPLVKRFLSDEEERWYMWYGGRPAGNSVSVSGSIGVAVSSNGIHWERGKGVVQSNSDVGLVLKSSNDWWAFDTNGVMPSEILIMSSSKIRASNAVYWLYYTGFSNEKIESLDNSLEFRLENPDSCGKNGEFGKIRRSLPGLAMSQDGRHWARIEGEHHSGALLDLGSEGEWDSMFISSPQVVLHSNGDLRMYYHSFDSEKGQFAIGMARSRDGMRWMKLGKIMGGGRVGDFDEYGVKNPCVVRNKKDGGYFMVYEGVDVDGRRSIGLAQSSDGLKDWHRVEGGPILKPAQETGCWDDGWVGSPYLVHMEGEKDEWRLYYQGVGQNGHAGIGMAVSEGNDVKSFRRWTGFHL